MTPELTPDLPASLSQTTGIDAIAHAVEAWHARTHAVILPYVAAFNLIAAPSARVALCQVLRTDEPGRRADLPCRRRRGAVLTRRARGGAGPTT